MLYCSCWLRKPSNVNMPGGRKHTLGLLWHSALGAFPFCVISFHGKGLFVRITATCAEGLGVRSWNEAAGSHPWLSLAFSVVWRHWHHEMSGLKMEMAWHCLGPIPGNASWIEALSCCPFSVTAWGEVSKIGHCYARRGPCSLSSLGFQVNELWR